MTGGVDRRQVLPLLFPEPANLLFVSGLAGASRDAAALTEDGANLYALGGAMGSATTVGLGLALAAPSRTVVVVTGDGELLMNVGALVTIANVGPPNLAIVCLDNGRHGETGNQPGHTSRLTDLELMAKGAGFSQTMTLRRLDETAVAATFLAQQRGLRFLVVKLLDTPPSGYRRLMDPVEGRLRFKSKVCETDPRPNRH